MSKARSWRSGAAVNTMLVSALCTGAFVGAYGFVSGGVDSTGGSTEVTTNAAGETMPVVASFTTANVGDCVNWDTAADGTVTNFQQASCSDLHRFEVSVREDLGIYPTSEFGPNAEMPDLKRQAQLREELCHSATISYLEGKFDPVGKYDIAPILPPAAAWAAGDRTMLCGLQSTDEKGIPQATTGKVSENDQANIAAAGDCRAIDGDQVLRTVPCADPHQLETTEVINLAEQFKGAKFPSTEAQDKYLNARCTKAAEDYLGGEENLYLSTLQPYWGSILEDSWNGGTRSVNCSLMHPNAQGTGFSAMTGSAKEGRDAMTIDGAAPTQPPKRNPLRNPGGNNGGGNNNDSTSSAAAPGAEPTPGQ